MHELSSNEYRHQLRSFFDDPSNGIILDADKEYQKRYLESSGGRAAFKLQSGQVVKKFITIWELFDEGNQFNECIERLTRKAQEIRQNTYYSYIVTATPVAKELCSQVFDRLKQDKDGNGLRIFHYGDYPNTPLPDTEFEQFKDENVLLLTDVISTSNLVRNMTEIIRKKGGKVVGILTIAITDPEWVSSVDQPQAQLSIEISQHYSVKIYNLTDYLISTLSEDKYDGDKLIPVDYASVLPENNNSLYFYQPSFTLEETFSHLESAKAVDFGFYEFDDRYCSCAIIVSKILNFHGNIIWEKIQSSLISTINENESLILVTTHKRQDLQFKDFVKDRFNIEGIDTTTVVTLKRGVKDIPSRNLTLGTKGNILKGKEILLVLATLSTPDKLHNLTSLLVSYEVKKITVVCLLNEMGPYTTSFLNAIRRFTRRIRAGQDENSVDLPTNQFTEFEFYMLYSFLDIGAEDIARMQKEVNWLFTRFNNKTLVPAFQRLSKRFRGYFDFQNFPSLAYEKSSYPLLPERYSLVKDLAINQNTNLEDRSIQSIEVGSQEVKIALITYYVALKRDFHPVINELKRASKRKTFIHLYGLILSDIHYLQFTRTLQDLKEQIIERLRELWLLCFEWEGKTTNQQEIDENEDDEIGKLIEGIVYLLLGLGIVANYESKDRSSNIPIENLLFCEQEPNQWLELYPKLAFIYFAEKRIFYAISFLIHGIFPRITQREKETLKELDRKIQVFRKKLNHFRDSFETQAERINYHILGITEEKIQIVFNNFDTILTEIGIHYRIEKHQIIRYLQREVLRPKMDHNPIFTSMNSLLDELEQFFQQDRSTLDRMRRFKTSNKILDRVDKALYSTGSLQIISEAAQQLYSFTPSVRKERERYTNPISHEESFAKDVNQLINLLQSRIRDDKICSYDDYIKLKYIYSKIRNDFYHSPFREAIESYVVALDDLVEQTLEETNERLKKEKQIDNLLDRAIEDIKQIKRVGSSWLILYEKNLLQETLRNLFFNLRYSFSPSEKQNFNRLSIRINLTKGEFLIQPDNQNQDCITFQMCVEGVEVPDYEIYIENKQNTITDQLYKIEEFGGKWRTIPDASSPSYIFEITFVSRIDFHRPGANQ